MTAQNDHARHDGGHGGGRRIAFQTLGCKLNQYETDAIAEEFIEAGYRVVPFADDADVYVINTCTVTNRADRKSRNLLSRTLRSDTGTEAGMRGGAPLVVLTGCYAEQHRDRLRREVAQPLGDAEEEGRLLVVGNPRKAHIPDLVAARLQGEVPDPDALPPDLFGFHGSERFHTRTSVKIQDGCDNFCSFCIVPRVRGRAVSRPAREVINAASAHIADGMREIVLTGVNMSRYLDEGPDGTIDFSALLEKLLALPGEFRLRISSLEPDNFDDRFYALLEHPKMAPHLHLCLQSGSDRILAAMRRRYDTAGFRDIVERVRRRMPDFNFTTDIVVGFPGEEEPDFIASLEMAREIGFSHIHTFPFSLRAGTRAAHMPAQLAESVKRERAGRIREVSDENKRRYRAALIGREEHVLIERPDASHDASGRIRPHGYGGRYVPVHISGAPDGRLRRNQLVRVRLAELATEGEPVLTGDAV
jgi:threonylcarbamoyladenosine tRNA methylthiotransferase MtaB